MCGVSEESVLGPLLFIPDKYILISLERIEKLP